MSRDAIKKLKKTIRNHGQSTQRVGQKATEQAALALLDRSVRMRHGRLAVQRLDEAVRRGALVSDDQWRYCREVASLTRNASIQTLFILTAQRAYANDVIQMKEQ